MTPPLMRAAVYKGRRTVEVESVPTPAIGPGELLVRVESCGICHTDLKKIEYDLLAPPRIYGHETAGVVVACGSGVRGYAPGDRVIAFHHIPCVKCFYCERKLYAQCAVYQKVGVTAGYEPAGGGFAQYVRVMDWIVARGVEKIPDGLPFETASFVEPVNTCLKGFVQLGVDGGDTIIVLGQGPIGLLFTMLAMRRGIRVFATDTLAARRTLAERLGAERGLNPAKDDVAAVLKASTGGRGADAAVIAASAPGIVGDAVRATRAGARILLFSQTSDRERVEVSGADICKAERVLFGSYSASVDLQRESADLVFSGALPVEQLISHRLPLNDIREGFRLALHPTPESLKIIVQPQRWS